MGRNLQVARAGGGGQMGSMECTNTQVCAQVMKKKETDNNTLKAETKQKSC